jgi:hypothetical protein
VFGRKGALKSGLFGELEDSGFIGELAFMVVDDIVNADAGRCRESAHTLPSSAPEDKVKDVA